MKINSINQNISFKSYNGALKEWHKSKPIFEKALNNLGNKKVSMIIQGPSFPSAEGEDFGIGSPYSTGASNIKTFFDGLVESIILGPWGATNKKYKHSPYMSTLDSLNPFFINFKALTTQEWDFLLTEETFNKLTQQYNSQNSSRTAKVDYEYGGKAVDIMLDEIYNNHIQSLANGNKRAIERENEIKIFAQNNRGIVLDKIYEFLTAEHGSNFHKWPHIDRELPILLENNDERAEERYHELCNKNNYELGKYIFTQYIAQKQISSPNYSCSKYIGDKQVAVCEADIWKLQDVILFESDGKKITLGVPGDHFSGNPRNWGMAVIDYNKLFDNNGNLTKGGEKIKRIYSDAFKRYNGGLRIDHFIGIVDPFVCVNDNGNFNNYSGRLYSSPENPVLKQYAYTNYTDEKYSRFFEKVILAAAKENGLNEKNIFPEDVGSITEAVEYVISKYNLPKMIITQFADPNNRDHKYIPSNANQKDVITTGTHDTAPEITYITSMDREQYYSRTKMLADETNQNESIFYKENGEGLKNAIQSEFACLFTSPAKDIHIFFPSFLGMDEYYNKPGDKSVPKWRLRIPNNFMRLYFENLSYNTAFNPYQVFAIALSKKGNNEELIAQLKEHEQKLLYEIKDMIKRESIVSKYDPFESGIMPIEERNIIFKKDAEYRKKIAAKLKIKDANVLSAIVGSEELTTILKNARREYFMPITDTENINADFNINLHMHTNKSDGSMTPVELLDKIQEYAERRRKPFLFAITDHDNIDASKEILEIIAKNPEKYNMVLFVPAIEMNAKYQNPSLSSKELGPNHTFQIEIVGYCLDPFNESLNEVIQEYRESNREYITNIIDMLKKEGFDVSFQEAEKISQDKNTHISYMGSPGLFKELINYLQQKAETLESDRRQILLCKINEIIENHIAKYGNKSIMPRTSSYCEIIKLIKEANGLSAIAHPAKIILSGTSKSGDSSIKQIINDFVKANGDFIEYNYQYEDVQKNQSFKNWIKLINDYYSVKYAERSGTGGIDNHGRSIFHR